MDDIYYIVSADMEFAPLSTEPIRNFEFAKRKYNEWKSDEDVFNEVVFKFTNGKREFVSIGELI